MKRGILLVFAWVLVLAASGNTLYAQFTYWEQTAGPVSIRTNVLKFNQVGNLYAGTNNGVYVTTNQGTDWNLLGMINSNVSDLAINPSRHIFAVQAGQGVYRSTNLGVNWTQVYTGTANAVAINTRGDVFIATDSGVVRSYDNGITWTYVPLPLLRKGLVAHIDAKDNLYIGTQSAGVFKSTDAGNTWINLNLPNVDVSVLYVAGGYVYAGSQYSGLYRAVANTTTWIEANAGLTSRNIKSLTSNAADYLVCGTGAGGVFRSTDMGGTWEDFNIGIPKQEIPALVTSSSDVIYAGTNSDKVYMCANSTVSVAPVSSVASFGIGENYPNPFAEETVIPLMNRNRDVTLAIYNLLGKKVYHKTISASNTVVPFTWNGSMYGGRIAPPGTYIVRITDKNRSTATRVIHKVKE